MTATISCSLKLSDDVDERGREGEHVAGGQARGDHASHEIRPPDRGRGGCR